jgi:hypothetical protein
LELIRKARGALGRREVWQLRVARVNAFYAEQMAALIAWMLVVRIDDLVKDGAISAVTRVFDALWRRRLRRSSILDKIINANTVLSKRSRPLSGPFCLVLTNEQPE